MLELELSVSVGARDDEVVGRIAALRPSSRRQYEIVSNHGPRTIVPLAVDESEINRARLASLVDDVVEIAGSATVVQDLRLASDKVPIDRRRIVQSFRRSAFNLTRDNNDAFTDLG